MGRDAEKSAYNNAAMVLRCMAVLFGLALLCSPTTAREFQPTKPVVIQKVRFVTEGRVSTERMEAYATAYFEGRMFTHEDWWGRIIQQVAEICAQQGYEHASVQPEVVALDLKEGAEKQQVEVLIRINEGQQYRIKRIEWSGVTVFKLDELRKFILVRPGEVCDLTTISSGTDAIERLYSSRGYDGTKVSPEPQLNSLDHTVVLKIHVDERVPVSNSQRPAPPGPPVTVRRVTFSNVKMVSLAKLHGIAAALYEGQTFWDDGWQQELGESIRDECQHEGYFKADVQFKVDVVGKAGNSQLVAADYWIDEGAQYTLKLIEFPGAKSLAFPVEQLRAAMPMADGEIFDTDKIRIGLENLRVMYGSKGYIHFTPVPDASIDEEGQEITLRIDIDQGPQYRMGKVDLRFTGSANAEALTQKWPLNTGAFYDSSLMEHFFEENKHLLPFRASPYTDCKLARHDETATVDVYCTFGDGK